jgi:hypothetical protein
VPTAGGAPTPLAASAGGISISADSSRVVYFAPPAFAVSSVPIAGGVPTLLTPPTAQVDTGVDPEISPDSSRVVYVARYPGDSGLQLHSVPITGGPSVSLSGPLVAGGGVRGPVDFAPDGSRVVYPADQDADEVVEIYSVPLTGGVLVKLSPPLVAGGDAGNFAQFTPDGRRSCSWPTPRWTEWTNSTSRRRPVASPGG